MIEKVSVVTLGCPKNEVDSEIIAGLIKEAGYSLTSALNEADAIVVNTCGFIREAKEESIETILELARYKEEGGCKKLIVAGCLSQRYKTKLSEELPQVDYFVGTGELTRIPELLNGSSKERVIVGEPTYLYDTPTYRLISSSPGSAYLKIAEGCSNHCSYCAIPIIRGEFRSRSEESIIREAEILADKGIKELNLIAQDTTSYGRDNGKATLNMLLKRLVRLKGIEWIRLLYLHPLRVSEELLRLIRDEERICKYIDLPLQHIDERILRAMKRGMEADDIKRLIERIRKIIEGVTLRTTFIVGFPGEDDLAFERLFEFVKEVEFDHLGVFRYSKEEDTPAYKLKGHLPERVKKDRYKRLMELQAGISLKKNKRLIGSVCKGIIEGISEENPYLLKARIEGQAPDVDGVTYVTKGEVNAGEIVSLFITDAGHYDLVAEVV